MIVRLRRLALRTAAYLLKYTPDEHHYVIVCEDCQLATNTALYASGYQRGVRHGFEQARKVFSPAVGEA